DVTSLQPTTINDAVRLAYQLAGQLIQDKADEATEGEKRKGEGDQGSYGDNRCEHNRRQNQRRDNKPMFKIIRADETHQLYISFATLLKNFDREDLETLWRLVKDRFSTSKPTNFLDEYLLLTLKTMFEEPDGQDAIWRTQKSVHVQLFLLVERRYLLSRFTLEQLVNVTRLQVEEESEISLELLRFTRQQL
nr:hypothetical protein [Tanacetum cinerariifolium]